MGKDMGGRRRRFRGWIWAVLLLWSCQAAAEQIRLELGPSVAEARLSDHVAYFHDASGEEDVGTARRRLASGDFVPLPAGNAAFGFQKGAFWFHADLVNRNPDEHHWLLVQEYPLSDRVDVYAFHASGEVVHQVGGDHVPFGQRALRYRHPNFRIALPYGEPVQLLVRVQSESSMQVPLVLYTQNAFTEVARDAQLGIGIYYGILVALFFYNLVLWLSLRDASYFWYLFHISAFGLVLFTLNGFGFEYLWPDWPWLADRSVPLSICLALIAMLQFARTFLGQARRFPRGNRVSLAFIGFFALLGLASIWLPYSISTPIASRAVLLGVLWIVIATVVVLRRGYTPAKLFLLAWATFLLGTAIFTLLAFGLLPKTFYTEYGVQIGSALEMLLLSVALGYRYAALRNENERIVSQAKTELERQVEQRTGELQHALAQLETAHARLREFSRHDGLTNLYNRTHFHEAFEQLLAQARDRQHPVSLLMIDLDHFKRINDRYGHMAGDECLRWVSRIMAETLRPYGALLARFGGEEFIAALPGLDLEAAREVAEQVRRQLRARPCRSGDDIIPLSASIGVHTADTDARSGIEPAMQVADQALYAAKAHGRDCVRTL